MLSVLHKPQGLRSNLMSCENVLFKMLFNEQKTEILEGLCLFFFPVTPASTSIQEFYSTLITGSKLSCVCQWCSRLSFVNTYFNQVWLYLWEVFFICRKQSNKTVAVNMDPLLWASALKTVICVKRTVKVYTNVRCCWFWSNLALKISHPQFFKLIHLVDALCEPLGRIKAAFYSSF